MHYWIATVSETNLPHVRPVAGMWVNDRLYIGGDSSARWYRNLKKKPSASVNLSEEGDKALILEGRAHFVLPDRELATQLADASNVKYKMGQESAVYEGEEMLEFHPETVFAWKVFYEDATKWVISPNG
jgi:uncharacterized pyridoxamine 5'-phosphate oxidase family protein